ncbi:hypothetical protein ACFFRR_011692 [Megaselia abdita]
MSFKGVTSNIVRTLHDRCLLKTQNPNDADLEMMCEFSSKIEDISSRFDELRQGPSVENVEIFNPEIEPLEILEDMVIVPVQIAKNHILDQVLNEISENTSLEIEEKEKIVLEKLIDYWKGQKIVKDIFEGMDRLTTARTFSILLSLYKHSIVRFVQFENFQLKEILIGPKLENISHLLLPY